MLWLWVYFCPWLLFLFHVKSLPLLTSFHCLWSPFCTEWPQLLHPSQGCAAELFSPLEPVVCQLPLAIANTAHNTEQDLPEKEGLVHHFEIKFYVTLPPEFCIFQAVSNQDLITSTQHFPVQSLSLDNIPSTIIKSRGLKTIPWGTPTFTVNPSFSTPFTLTLELEQLSGFNIAYTSHLSTNILSDHHTNSLCTK